MSNVGYNLAPPTLAPKTYSQLVLDPNRQKNSVTWYSRTASAAESQIQSCSQRFCSRKVAIAIGVAVAVVVVAVVGFTVLKLTSLDDEQKEVESLDLADRNITTVTHSAKMVTTALQHLTKEVSTVTCATSCPFGWEPVCGSDGVTYPTDCVLNLITCDNEGGPYKVSEGECPP